MDLLGHLAYLTKSAHFKGPHQSPEPISRPGDGGRPERLEIAEPPVMSTPQEIRAFFGGAATQIVVTDS